MNFDISLTIDLPKSTYTYSFENYKISIGQLVEVDLRNRKILGIVTGQSENLKFDGKIKKISSVLPYEIRTEYIDFAKFISDYNVSTFGGVLKLLCPFSIDQILCGEKNIKAFSFSGNLDVSLSDEQKLAVKLIEEYKSLYKTVLIHGITGSGKTEVFLDVLKRIDNQILILVPEIALSNELAKKVSQRLGRDVFIWHNSVSKSRKLSIWKKAINGDDLVIVGARSSLFIPFSNLKVIVIDEEHDMSFKQDEGLVYNARDMAIYLGSLLKIPVLLSSATPSVESYNNAISGKYGYVKLEHRFFEKAKLPQIIINDLKSSKTSGVLSAFSISEIQRCLGDNKQCLIFVNRRGHTPKIICGSCGEKLQCPGCSAFLCYHQKTNNFRCHYCDFTTSIKMECPSCGEKSLIGLGTGVEKVAQECERLFPQARTLVVSSDTFNSASKIEDTLNQIKSKSVDIIIGTQIISKGHNFDSLNLVVITCLDAMLYGDDFRSIEKTFQVTTQVSGRAGRSDECFDAKVIIQTYNPNDDFMKLIKTNDFNAFYQIEIENRKKINMPPFGKMASVILSSLNEKELLNFAKDLLKNRPEKVGVKVFGPIQPAIYKIRSRYRLRFLIISKTIALQNFLKDWLDCNRGKKEVRMVIDIDPYDFW